MAIAPHDFAHRNLRNRSFRGQILLGADFSHCDLRGCDFSGAQLQNATFNQARLGYAPEPVVQGLMVIAGSGAIAFHAFSTLIFGSLGHTPEHPAYRYGVVLAVFLAAAGIAMVAHRPGAIAARVGADRSITKTALALVNGALLGFFYAGTAMAQTPQAAILGAVVGGSLGAIASRFLRSALWSCTLLTVGSLATYGFVFLAGVNAMNHLSVGQIFRGSLWLWGSGVYLGLTLRGLTLLGQVLSTSAQTTFFGAEVTGAHFPKDLSQDAIARYGIQSHRTD